MNEAPGDIDGGETAAGIYEAMIPGSGIEESDDLAAVVDPEASVELESWHRNRDSEETPSIAHTTPHHVARTLGD